MTVASCILSLEAAVRLQLFARRPSALIIADELCMLSLGIVSWGKGGGLLWPLVCLRRKWGLCALLCLGPLLARWRGRVESFLMPPCIGRSSFPPLLLVVRLLLFFHLLPLPLPLQREGPCRCSAPCRPRRRSSPLPRRLERRRGTPPRHDPNEVLHTLSNPRFCLARQAGRAGRSFHALYTRAYPRNATLSRSRAPPASLAFHSAQEPCPRQRCSTTRLGN